MTCVPLRFGIRNQVPDATLTSTPAPVTTLDWLKDEWRARQVVFDDPSEDIVIEGAFDDLQFGDFFALPNSNLHGLASLKLELYLDPLAPVDVLSMGFVPLAELIPLGEWRAGVDPYGIPRDIDRPEVFVYWFDRTASYKGFKLTIRHDDYAAAIVTDVRLRMMLIGEKLQLENNFNYGSTISFVRPPDLVLTSSGSYVERRKQLKSRALSLSLDHMTDADRAGLWRMESTLEGRPFIVSAYPEEPRWMFNNYSILSRFEKALPFTHAYNNAHATQITLLEV